MYQQRLLVERNSDKKTYKQKEINIVKTVDSLPIVFQYINCTWTSMF